MKLTVVATLAIVGLVVQVQARAPCSELIQRRNAATDCLETRHEGAAVGPLRSFVSKFCARCGLVPA
jgi:hypothetical protein